MRKTLKFLNSHLEFSHLIGTIVYKFCFTKMIFDVATKKFVNFKCFFYTIELFCEKFIYFMNVFFDNFGGF